MRKNMDIYAVVAKHQLKLASEILAEKEEAKKRYTVQTDSGIIIGTNLTLKDAEKLVEGEENNHTMWEEKQHD